MTDGDRIRELDDATVAQIAAGEVVERPASVVKELVENSLDAGAASIDVTVEGGGRDRIVVADDGHGMTREDLRAAVRQHTTSKLSDASELDAVATLGFRGEALYTVGSVSRMTVTTRAKDAGDSGATLTVDHGDVGDLRPAGRPAGTTVEVAELFAETPARRKYLKRPATEFAHVNRAVTRYALANSDVAVSLTHDGREVFATTGTGDVRDAALSVYGREVAQSLVPVDATPEGPVERVHGYVSDPETTRSTREYLATYVNGRSVRDGVLREAVLDAYGGQLAADRYPFTVLFVETEGVDANVHPRKMEVRFEDEDGVQAAVEDAVRDALLDAGIVRSQAPRGASKPGDATISPESEDGDERGAPQTTREEGSSNAAADVAVESAEHRSRATDSLADSEPDSTERKPSGPDRESDAIAAADDSDESDDSGAKDESERTTTRSSFDAPTENAQLTETDRADSDDAGDGFDSLPSLRVLGQLAGTYVVAETEDGLVLVDQHAADERVHYERLQEQVGGASQALVSPVELELTAGEAAVFDAAVEDLRDLGFDAELSGRTARVTAVPAVLADALEPELARDVLADFLADAGGDPASDAADELLADLACRPAVTGNTSLTEGSVVALLDALDDCENPYACPHGRPTLIRVDADELATRFERDYPGHGGRRREDGGN
ncbi:MULTISPECIES: DNA mismatch repair endonuclease MutL [Halobacterium]|uniref:DNA mismatch repair endonuclease MutL n=1 Tax=Halobacterium TaxID=2239 RepID=UPI00073F79FA|nr:MULTISPECIES: DNA mismatch repair endonuclease MutL [Halobacterium]MCG1002100.1 DNA mismatch repair endonuclease MutL [Halobacterium noricense]